MFAMKSLLLLVATLAGTSNMVDAQPKTGHFVQQAKNFVECFSDLREQGLFHYPVEDKSLCDVSSVFGPAISSCTGLPRFNRAMAVHGSINDVVMAPYSGVVVEVTDVPNDLDFRVVIEHSFPTMELCEFHGHRVTKFYTTYEKLGSVNVAVGDNVQAGDPIGLIGNCIRHCGTSLLMSLRVGASCSLGYANNYKATHGSFPSCNNKGFDPHANPLLLAPTDSDETHFTVEESQCWGPDEDGAIEVDSLTVTTDCAGADINRYEVTCGDLFHVIDFNYRTSFDASSAASLHEAPSGDVPYIQAFPYKVGSTHWTQQVIIPDEWYHAGGGDDCCTVDVYDTWGNTEQQKVCGTSRHYISMFAQMRDDTGFAWPVPNSHRVSIFSSFGVRSDSYGSDSFHNGVDIQAYEGDPVVAVYDGKVTTRRKYTNGGRTIMLKHNFPGNTATKLNNECGVGDRIAADTFYTQYQHLSRYAVSYGQEVKKGDIIGYVGSTGEAAEDPFLHLELRFGTKCTLKYCVEPENVNKDCCQFGYEPTIHPFLLFDPIFADVWFDLRTPPSTENHEDGVVNLHTLSHQASINVIEWVHSTEIPGATFDCYDAGTFGVKVSHKKDLSVKTGFYTWENLQQDPSAAPSDVRDPYIVGLPVGNTPMTDLQAWAMEWNVDTIIPHEWIGSVEEGDHLIVIVTDVWGESHCGSWPIFEGHVAFGVSHPAGKQEGHGHEHK